MIAITYNGQMDPQRNIILSAGVALLTTNHFCDGMRNPINSVDDIKSQ